MKVKYFLLLLPISLLGSCNLQTDYFKDYVGVNLISGRVFDPNPLTNTWLIPSSILAGEVAFTEIPGLTSGKSAWRLRIPNAIADGDFEAGGTGVVLSGSGTDSIVSAAPALIDGTNSLSLVSTSLAAFRRNLSGLPTGIYQIQYDYRTLKDYQFNSLDPSNPSSNQASFLAWTSTFEQTSENTQVNDATLTHRASLNPFRGFQPLSVVNGSNYYLEWTGIQTDWSAVIDNLSAVRTDLPLKVESTIQDLTATSAKLLPGIYEFSVFVLDDPQAATGNVFHPRSVTIQVTVTTTDGTQSYLNTVARPSLGWATWTKLTLRMIDVNIPDILPGGSPYAMKLSISPTGFQDKDKWAGSVLVAEPRLEFFER